MAGYKDFAKHSNNQRRNRRQQRDKPPKQDQQARNDKERCSIEVMPHEDEIVMRKDPGSFRENELPANTGHEPIQEIDTIFKGPDIRKESRNAQRNYVREFRDPTMVIRVQLITFTQNDAIVVHYSHCNALVVKVIVA